jgi:trimeric autotransporter adhesin
MMNSGHVKFESFRTRLSFTALKSTLNFRGMRVCKAIALVLAALVALAAGAMAQTNDFTLQMSPFQNFAVDPGGTTSANLSISASNGFTGSVSLSCSISPAPANGNAGCLVSPATVTAPNGASVTVNTFISSGVDWMPNLYTITITATSPSAATQTASQSLSVLSVTSAFTITVAEAVTPTSVPAGSSSTATINVTALNDYTGTVTMACTSVSPVVVSPPVCTFTPANVTFPPTNGGSVVPTTLTISTIGPLTTTEAAQRKKTRYLYALWLPLPMLALFGVSAAVGGKRSRAWAILGLFVMGGFILLIPACSTTTTPTAINSTDIITPNGTYTFTVTGVDENGNEASNTSTGSTSAVTLTVTTAVN